jgi:hypothetical protein
MTCLKSRQKSLYRDELGVWRRDSEYDAIRSFHAQLENMLNIQMIMDTHLRDGLESHNPSRWAARKPIVLPCLHTVIFDTDHKVIQQDTLNTTRPKIPPANPFISQFPSGFEYPLPTRFFGVIRVQLDAIEPGELFGRAIERGGISHIACSFAPSFTGETFEWIMRVLLRFQNIVGMIIYRWVSKSCLVEVVQHIGS